MVCGRQATLNLNLRVRAQELCESRGGRPGLPVPHSPNGLCGRKAALNIELVAFVLAFVRRANGIVV